MKQTRLQRLEELIGELSQVLEDLVKVDRKVKT